MTAAELLSFLREHSRVVQASVSRFGSAQAAAVGVVVTDDFEIFFDSAGESRKVENLRRNPRIAFVIGGTAAGDERTVQYEGVADEPTGAELDRLTAALLRVVPRRTGPPELAGHHLHPRAADVDSFQRLRSGPPRKSSNLTAQSSGSIDTAAPTRRRT